MNPTNTTPTFSYYYSPAYCYPSSVWGYRRPYYYGDVLPSSSYDYTYPYSYSSYYKSYL